MDLMSAVVGLLVGNKNSSNEDRNLELQSPKLQKQPLKECHSISPDRDGNTQQLGPKVWEIVGEQQEILRITGIAKIDTAENLENPFPVQPM
ncbi:ATPase 7 [Spatholobus suberectus]|nr:ATPase 7 [Spatholobus suberectus]